MRTIKITTENDYAALVSELTGKNATANCGAELRKICEDAIPLLWKNRTEDDLIRWYDASYAPTVIIRLNKKNAHALDEFLRNYEISLMDDYIYNSLEDGEIYDSIEECPGDKVDISFILFDLSVLNKLLEDVAGKLSELNEDADVLLTFLFPKDDGAFVYTNGARENGNCSLVWEITDGKIKNLNSKMIILGDDFRSILYHGIFLLAETSIADWKRLFNVDIEVEINLEIKNPVIKYFNDLYHEMETQIPDAIEVTEKESLLKNSGFEALFTSFSLLNEVDYWSIYYLNTIPLDLTYKTVNHLASAIGRLYRYYIYYRRMETEQALRSVKTSLAGYLMLLCMNEHNCIPSIYRLGSDESLLNTWAGYTLKVGTKEELDLISVADNAVRITGKGNPELVTDDIVEAYKRMCDVDLNDYKIGDSSCVCDETEEAFWLTWDQICKAKIRDSVE